MQFSTSLGIQLKSITAETSYLTRATRLNIPVDGILHYFDLEMTYSLTDHQLANLSLFRFSAFVPNNLHH
jgi:hypothetical protein